MVTLQEFRDKEKTWENYNICWDTLQKDYNVIFNVVLGDICDVVKELSNKIIINKLHHDDAENLMHNAYLSESCLQYAFKYEYAFKTFVWYHLY